MMHGYEKYLIHRTRRGMLVSSRAEVAIANELDYARSKRWLDYQYEERLCADDGSSRLPDFTVRDELGRTFHWEHCGLPEDASYSSRWGEKLAWYHKLGFSQWNAVTNPDGRLIVTKDIDGSLDTEVVRKIIIELFKG